MSSPSRPNNLDPATRGFSCSPVHMGTPTRHCRFQERASFGGLEVERNIADQSAPTVVFGSAKSGRIRWQASPTKQGRLKCTANVWRRRNGRNHSCRSVLDGFHQETDCGTRDGVESGGVCGEGGRRREGGQRIEAICRKQLTIITTLRAHVAAVRCMDCRPVLCSMYVLL